MGSGEFLAVNYFAEKSCTAGIACLFRTWSTCNVVLLVRKTQRSKQSCLLGGHDDFLRRMRKCLMAGNSEGTCVAFHTAYETQILAGLPVGWSYSEEKQSRFWWLLTSSILSEVSHTCKVIMAELPTFQGQKHVKLPSFLEIFLAWR